MNRHCAAVNVVLLFFVVLAVGEKRPLIETSLGKIEGYYKKSYDGRTFSAFEGVPFAKPPIGNLRFEEPVEPEPWTGIWNATMTHTCLQKHWQLQQPVGSEDCLYLNIYVPVDENVEKSNLDVIVHFHGGAFMAGDANMAGPLYLMDRNIVYVNINYRLGALGFLSTEDDVVPGNNGMKDQVMALRWVQKHVDRFGGNPNSVTITGLSAGAGSVHLHYFSPLSKGLFHKGISQGGTALAPWAIYKAPLKTARKLATSIGCEYSSTKQLVECLKTRSARQIIETTYESPIVGFPLTPFAPVIEKESPSAFLTDYPYELLKSGSIVNDVPWMAGATTEEGILGLIMLRFKLDDLNNRWETVLPYVLDYVYTVAESDKPEMAKRIKEFYFNDKQLSDDEPQSFIRLFSDRYFHLDLERASRLHAKLGKSPVYTYLYGYKESVKPNSFFGLPKDYGVNHGGDAHLLYEMKFGGITIIEGKLPESDVEIKDFLLDAFTSFAKNGKPISSGTSWESTTDASDFKYLFIHNDGIKMDSKREIAPKEFWESLPLKEYDNFSLKKNNL